MIHRLQQASPCFIDPRSLMSISTGLPETGAERQVFSVSAT